MRIAFYSPMAQSDAGAASGVQRMSALLQRALEAAGCEVWAPSLPRCYEGRGDPARQQELRVASEGAADALVASAPKIDAWFSYHVYYKSPDWIGPRVAPALRVPYLIAEGSHAPKRAEGPWALGHAGTTAALQAADRLLAMTAFDRLCLAQIAPGRVRDLKPFVDVAPFQPSAHEASPVRLCTVATMRDERKRESYRLLAQAMKLLDVPVELHIAGDGAMRAEIEARFHGVEGARFHGMIAAAEIPAFLQRCDVFAWPGLGEAYGLVFLEAQAAGLPVVACRDHGVPDTVSETITALLSPPGDVAAYAASLRRLVLDGAMRARMGAAARSFVTVERSVEAAGSVLKAVLRELRS